MKTLHASHHTKVFVPQSSLRVVAPVAPERIDRISCWAVPVFSPSHDVDTQVAAADPADHCSKRCSNTTSNRKSSLIMVARAPTVPLPELPASRRRAEEPDHAVLQRRLLLAFNVGHHVAVCASVDRRARALHERDPLHSDT